MIHQKTGKAKRILERLRSINGDVEKYNTQILALRGELEASRISLVDIGTSEEELTHLDPAGK